MKYQLLQEIPGVGTKGCVIENTKFPYLNFNDKNHFIKYEEPLPCLYNVGEIVLYSDKFLLNEKLYVVTKINGNTMEIHPEGCFSKNFKPLKLKINETKCIKKTTWFWFISSKGVVQSDFIERKGLSKYSYEYLENTNNIFGTKDDAVKKLQSIMGTTK